MHASMNDHLPARLSRLSELAHDLWWTWNVGRDVFRRLDYALWRQTAHNAVMMLQRISPAALERAAADPAFLAAYDAAVTTADALHAPTAPNWWQTRAGVPSSG